VDLLVKGESGSTSFVAKVVPCFVEGESKFYELSNWIGLCSKVIKNPTGYRQCSEKLKKATDLCSVLQ